MLVLKGSDNSTLWFRKEKSSVKKKERKKEAFFSLKNLPAFFSGDIYEEEIWVDEEGI